MEKLFESQFGWALALQCRTIDDLTAIAAVGLDAIGRLQALQHAWLRQTLDDCRARVRSSGRGLGLPDGSAALYDAVAPAFERAAQYLHGVGELGRASGTAVAERLECCAWQGPHLLADGLEAAATMRAG